MAVWLESGHEVFKQGNKITHNRLMDEFRAMAHYGLIMDEYYEQARSVRAMMVAQQLGETMAMTMKGFDDNPPNTKRK